MAQTACPSTEKIQEWWTMAQAKGATKLYAVQDHGIYRLRAFTDNRKKCGEISLGLRDERIAHRIVNTLAVKLNDDSPASVIEAYIADKESYAETCRQGKHTELVKSTENTIKTIKARLNAHLLPFSKRHNITSIKELYRAEIIRAYIDELHTTVAIGDTARSIMASTLTMLKWYNGRPDPSGSGYEENKQSLLDQSFKKAIEGWRSTFGFKRSRPKTFLNPEQIQAIFRYSYPDERTKAMFLFPLVCGLRYNEFVNLRWCDLDAEKGAMHVLVAKGGTSRMAQYPKLMQNFLENVRKKRRTGVLNGDYIFKNFNRNRDLTTYRSLLKGITGIESKDAASNCLRRSGCDLIERYQHGLGDRQLGHSVCTRITQRSYINNDDYSDVNYFWDTFYQICMAPNTVVGIERVRQMAMRPENVIDIFQPQIAAPICG